MSNFTVWADWDANAPNHIMARFTTYAEAKKYRDAMWKDNKTTKQKYCHPYVDGWEFMKSYKVDPGEPVIYTTAAAALEEETA